MKKAYSVTITNWPRHEAIIAAETPGKAKNDQFVQAREAGFKVPFTSLRAKRKPQFDHLIPDAKKSCLGWKDTVSSWGCL